MSFPLFRATLKANWVIAMIFALLLCMYLGSIISLYDPASSQALEDMLKLFPEALAKAMGISDLPKDLTGFLGNSFYGMLVFLLPLIYIAVMGNRLMAKYVDNGSMAYFLSTPNTRGRIALTQGIYFIAGIFALFLVLTMAGIGICQAVYPGHLDMPSFLLLNFCAFLLTCAISAISWFFSCAFSDVKYSLAFGAGIPVLFFMLNVLGGMQDGMGWAASLSLYGIFDASAILTGSANILQMCLLFAGITLTLYAAGILIFKKKSLPL